MLKAHEAYPELNQQRVLHGVALRDEGAAGRRRRIELRSSVFYLWSVPNRKRWVAGNRTLSCLPKWNGIAAMGYRSLSTRHFQLQCSTA